MTTPGAKPRVLPALTLMLAALLVPRSASSASQPVSRDDVDAILAQEELAGAAWSRVDADGTIAVGAAGVRDLRSGQALSADDRVHIGSVTKTLLAAGVLRLAAPRGIPDHSGTQANPSPCFSILPTPGNGKCTA